MGPCCRVKHGMPWPVVAGFRDLLVAHHSKMLEYGRQEDIPKSGRAVTGQNSSRLPWLSLLPAHSGELWVAPGGCSAVFIGYSTRNESEDSNMNRYSSCVEMTRD